MNQANPKMAEYENYCKKCEHWEVPDHEDPCNECLDYPVNHTGSRKPVNWKEKSE